MNPPMPKELLYALIAREGLKTALQLHDIWTAGDDVTPEMLARLKELAGRTAEDYEKSPQS